MRNGVLLWMLIAAAGTACGVEGPDGAPDLSKAQVSSAPDSQGASAESVGAAAYCEPGHQVWQCFEGSGFGYPGSCPGGLTYKWAPCWQYTNYRNQWYRICTQPMRETCVNPNLVFEGGACFQIC